MKSGPPSKNRATSGATYNLVKLNYFFVNSVPFLDASFLSFNYLMIKLPPTSEILYFL